MTRYRSRSMPFGWPRDALPEWLLDTPASGARPRMAPRTPLRVAGGPERVENCSGPRRSADGVTGRSRMGLPSPEQASTWGGKMLVDREGAPIGTVAPRSTATTPPGCRSGRRSGSARPPRVPAAARRGGGRRAGPRPGQARRRGEGPDGRAGPADTAQEEARLYRYYGIDYTPERSPSGAAAGCGPVPSRAELLLRRARALELVPLALAGAMTAAAVVIAVLGLRGGGAGPGRGAPRCSPVRGGCQGCEGGAVGGGLVLGGGGRRECRGRRGGPGFGAPAAAPF